MESNKEYQYRCLLQDIIDYIEKNTDNFDDLCDCELEFGNHQELCKTNLMRKDFENFENLFEKIKTQHSH